MIFKAKIKKIINEATGEVEEIVENAKELKEHLNRCKFENEPMEINEFIDILNNSLTHK